MVHGNERRSVRRTAWGLVILVAAAAATGFLPAYGRAEAADEGPPLPLHTIEGVGGVVITPMAYLVNPGPPGTVVGKPAIGAHFATIGSKDLEALTLTWTLWRRLELGYGVNRLGLGDLGHDVRKATGLSIGTGDVWLHHLNARLSVIEENQWDQAWMPAVTAGVHYKYNSDINEIDRRVAGTLTGLGLKDNDGVDFTLTASKTLTWLPRPVIVTAGARASKATELGLLGFTDDYRVTFEGNVAVLATDRLVLVGEYRQKESDQANLPGLVGREDNWWTVGGAYIINNRMTVTAAYGNFGTVANQSDEQGLALAFKYEF